MSEYHPISTTDSRTLFFQILLQNRFNALPEAFETTHLQPAERLRPLFPNLHQPCVFQNRQVFGNRRLIRTNQLCQFADAQFLLPSTSSIINRLGCAIALATRARASYCSTVFFFMAIWQYYHEYPGMSNAIQKQNYHK